MATTMTLIAKQTVGANGAASVTFSNIPQTYTDLKVVVSARNTSSAEIFDFGFNGVTTNQTSVYLNGSGSSATSGTYTLFGRSVQTGATASTFSNNEIYIANYTSSNNKSVSIDGVNENNATGAYASLVAGLWSSSAAITSITFTASFAEFSTFYLYGISNSTTTQNTTVPYAYGGDIITTDGTYWYHAFKYSGSFVPQKNLTAEVLVVAGGGGGGAYVGGGGGAGGVSYHSGKALTSGTSYTCTIGAGGTAGAIVAGGVGSNSIFDTIISNGGGGGAYNNDPTPINGGSGGGAAYNGGAGVGGSATQGNTGGATGYGFRGGNISGGSAYAATGGGGSGGQGVDSTSGAGGTNGGPGKNTWSTWLSATNLGVSGYIAGGGGGGGDGAVGSGGSGGGGTGGLNNSSATNAIANTGSGGGGTRGYNIYYGGTGGSGLVIVRYAV